MTTALFYTSKEVSSLKVMLISALKALNEIVLEENNCGRSCWRFVLMLLSRIRWLKICCDSSCFRTLAQLFNPYVTVATCQPLIRPNLVTLFRHWIMKMGYFMVAFDKRTAVALNPSIILFAIFPDTSCGCHDDSSLENGAISRIWDWVKWVRNENNVDTLGFMCVVPLSAGVKKI